MIKVIINEFHGEIGFGTDLATWFFLFCLRLLSQFPLILQTHISIGSFVRSYRFSWHWIIAYIAIELIHAKNLLTFFFWYAVTDLMEACVASVTVKNFIYLLIIFSWKTYFTVRLEQWLQFLQWSWLFLPHWLLHIHLFYSNYFKCII